MRHPICGTISRKIGETEEGNDVYFCPTCKENFMCEGNCNAQAE